MRARVRNHLELKAARDLLRHSATRDQLTGLANRREFDSHLEREFARAARTGASLAVAMLDLDHFKSYNDRYGHQAGDRALQRFAGVLREGLRAGSDQAHRWGGEEFALLLADTDGPGAATVIERLRASLAADELTFSAGIALLGPADEASPSELVRRADLALYLAKRCGRDQVRFWHPGLEPGADDEARPGSQSLPEPRSAEEHPLARAPDHA